MVLFVFSFDFVSALLEVTSKNINNFTYQYVNSRCIAGIKAVIVTPLMTPKLKLSCCTILTPPRYASTRQTNLSQLSQLWAILFIGRAPRPQALILMKITPAARIYGLHLCSEVFFIFFRQEPIDGMLHIVKTAIYFQLHVILHDRPQGC